MVNLVRNTPTCRAETAGTAQTSKTQQKWALEAGPTFSRKPAQTAETLGGVSQTETVPRPRWCDGSGSASYGLPVARVEERLLSMPRGPGLQDVADRFLRRHILTGQERVGPPRAETPTIS